MPSILVVDDDEDTCRDMADLFGDLGFVVDAADDGHMALKKEVGQQPYGLGLLDLRMTEMDGLTLCRHLRRLRPGMVTMIITAYGAGSLAEKAYDAGARHILSKPVDFPRLLALVEEALQPAK
jgi:CheY-like chemotaxis protein